MRMGNNFFMAKISELGIWPGASELVPALSQPEYQALKASISQNGIRKPLSVVKPGRKFTILDGASRFAIAQELGMSEIPVRLVPISPDEYAPFCLLQAANRKNLQAGQRAALACMLTRELVRLRRDNASWRAFQKWLPGFKDLANTKTHQIAVSHFASSTGYLSLARKIHRQSPETFRLLLQGHISMSEAEKSISAVPQDDSNEPAEKLSVHELKVALHQAQNRIRELEEGRKRIQKHLEVLLPFARKALR